MFLVVARALGGRLRPECFNRPVGLVVIDESGVL